MSGAKPEGGSVALGSCENRVLKLSLEEWESEIASRSYKGSEWLKFDKKTPNPPAGLPDKSAGFGIRTRGPWGKPARGAGPAPAGVFFG